MLARLLGKRASRLQAWAFVRERWNDLTRQMDPMLQQNIIRALAQLTPSTTAADVCEFLPARATNETRETISQTVEQLRIDSAVCQRLAPAVTASLQQLV